MSSAPNPAGSFGFAGPVPPPTAPAPRISRNAMIVGGVLLFHAVALWGLQTGLLRRVVEIVVPVEMLSEIVTPPAPKVEPPPPAPPVRPQPPVKQPVVKQQAPALPPAPQPIAIADPTPSPNAPAGVTAPQPPAPPIAAPVAAAPAPQAPPRIELPSSDPDYLRNPRPPYPPVSKRLGEQGKVLVGVLIGPDGSAQKAEIRKSSGYDRLDQAALAAVLKWRYVPGKRGGVAEAMWCVTTIDFSLE